MEYISKEVIPLNKLFLGGNSSESEQFANAQAQGFTMITCRIDPSSVTSWSQASQAQSGKSGQRRLR